LHEVLNQEYIAFINITPCENTPVQYLHSTGLTVWLRNVGHDGEVQPARLDEFDQWYLRHILRVPFTAHVTNQEVRRRSTQPPVTQTVVLRRLRFFGHVIRSDPDEDHTRALNAGINDPPKEWRRPRGRPRQTWLRTIENDLKHQNLGLWSARHRAYDHDLWRDIVETATLRQGHVT